MSLTNLFRQKRTRIELHLTDAQIDQLRAVMDGLPLNPYVNLVVTVLKALPLESDRNQAGTATVDAGICAPTPKGSLPNSLGIESAAMPPSGADADRRDLHAQGPGGGFSITALTPKGRERLPEIERLLSRLPHGGGGDL